MRVSQSKFLDSDISISDAFQLIQQTKYLLNTMTAIIAFAAPDVACFISASCAAVMTFRNVIPTRKVRIYPIHGKNSTDRPCTEGNMTGVPQMLFTQCRIKRSFWFSEEISAFDFRMTVLAQAGSKGKGGDSWSIEQPFELKSGNWLMNASNSTQKFEKILCPTIPNTLKTNAEKSNTAYDKKNFINFCLFQTL